MFEIGTFDVFYRFDKWHFAFVHHRMLVTKCTRALAVFISRAAASTTNQAIARASRPLELASNRRDACAGFTVYPEVDTTRGVKTPMVCFRATITKKPEDGGSKAICYEKDQHGSDRPPSCMRCGNRPGSSQT